ncbi:MAG TPA: cytochrome c nitrite reductase small subunit [Bacteroidales bacterium]|nr:cytochrome c nitrite reductase small subunit [Bacteroidales bacterium]HSA42465.1 cytochrome c nitrite reductase small subunit [Bacteroidales bacterium]
MIRIPRWLYILRPPDRWHLPVIILLGVLTGFGIYVFIISRAPSYLSDDPATCTNCHIMGPQYATWFHSSHREVAVCNDCHVPHDNLFNKYLFKAKDGLRHATIFTLRAEPQVIFAKEASIGVIQMNCIRCHEKQVTNDAVSMSMRKVCEVVDQERLCWECHREVPHGRVNSLSSVPYARVPLPASPVIQIFPSPERRD